MSSDQLWLSSGIDVKKRIIYLGSNDDEIGADLVEKLTKALVYLGPKKPIRLMLNIPGGDWAQGMALYQLISQFPAPITIVALGEVCSQAAVVFLAGATRVVTADTIMMVHDGDFGVNGSPQSVKAWADFEASTLRPRYHQIIASRLASSAFNVIDRKGIDLLFRNPFAAAERICRHDTLFSAAEMIEMGFAHRLMVGSDLC